MRDRVKERESVCVCVRVCVCSCVRARERARERESDRVCVTLLEREWMCCNLDLYLYVCRCVFICVYIRN